MNKRLMNLLRGLLVSVVAVTAAITVAPIAYAQESVEHPQEAEEHQPGGNDPHEEHAGEEQAEHEAEGAEGGPEHTDNAEEDGHEGEGEHEEPELALSPDLLRDFGVEIASADAGVIHRQVSLPGEVQLNAEAVAHITPRFPAKIVEVRAKTGDSVEAGDVLAVAESSETLARFELRSMIDGVVIKRRVALGEHLAPGDTAFVVADLSTLWVDIALYPKQVPLVKVGQPVRIATSHGPEPVEARIDYVAPLVDERTRTGLARVFLANESRNWKPGMFVEGNITLGEFPVEVVVPETAVINLEGQPTIFVQQDGRWEARPVKLGREDSDSVEIVAGLEAGERYVAEGGFILKAQLQKSELESGHGH